MATTKITVNNNGSLRVEVDFQIVDMQGNSYGLQGRTVVSLCRCGQSNNKPFCDGSHNIKGVFTAKPQLLICRRERPDKRRICLYFKECTREVLQTKYLII